MDGSSTAALDRLLDPLSASLDPEAARQIVAFRLAPDVQERIAELAGRCNEGLLSGEERAEYEGYVAGVGLINVLQAKARRAVEPAR